LKRVGEGEARKKKKMLSVSRSTLFTLPTLISPLIKATSPRLVRMASPSHNDITTNNNDAPENKASVSPSSAIDFLTLCHSLKVGVSLIFAYICLCVNVSGIFVFFYVEF